MSSMCEVKTQFSDIKIFMNILWLLCVCAQWAGFVGDQGLSPCIKISKKNPYIFNTLLFFFLLLRALNHKQQIITDANRWMRWNINVEMRRTRCDGAKQGGTERQTFFNTNTNNNNNNNDDRGISFQLLLKSSRVPAKKIKYPTPSRFGSYFSPVFLNATRKMLSSWCSKWN